MEWVGWGLGGEVGLDGVCRYDIIVNCYWGGRLMDWCSGGCGRGWQ